MLPENVYREMENVVGEDNISQDPAILEGYAFQPFHKAASGAWIPRPEAVGLPSTTEEVQKIVKICHKFKIKFKAHSTGWGAMGGPGSEGVLQIDLRRMNRIVKIDQKNMYAVVEPYVTCAQLQAEAMKLGLNCHIIGAGSGTSPLASCTSHMGMGWSSISTGYNNRNVLAVEWVLPTGDILRLGTLGMDVGWFCGDGPGPSLRGVMRGWAGADGGIGVFTKCAVKLYPWQGPREVRVKGLLMDVETEIPEDFKTYTCFLPNWEAYANAVYKIGEAGIGFIQCKNAIGLALATMAPEILRSIKEDPERREFFKNLQHIFIFMLAANSKGELDYQEKALMQIMEEEGGQLIQSEQTGSLFLPPEISTSFDQAMWWGLVRASLPPLIFRIGGSFLTTFGGDEAWDAAVNQAKRGEEIKQDFIDRDLIIDDLADNSWGGIYEHGLIGHQEELVLFNPRDKKQAEAIEQFVDTCAEAAAEESLGIGFSLFAGKKVHEFFGLRSSNYHVWQRKIKKLFDPDDLSDSTYYISPEE
ncbi:MAG: FAD-binding oxidoreductase [Candidatus Lokiarchaeia archaeon]